MTRAGVGWHPDSRVVDIGGTATHVVRARERTVAGDDAPTVVLIHGFLVSSWSWRFNIDALARRFEVVAPCQPGFGWSARPRKADLSIPGLARHLLAVLDRLDVERAHLVGNSLGGAVALWIAQHAPERVDRLVLVNALALAKSLPPVPERLVGPALAPFMRVFVSPTVARLGLQALAYRRFLVDSRYIAGFREPFRQRRSMRLQLRVARGLFPGARLVERGLPRVRQPTLVVWGTGDRLLGGRTGFSLHRRIAGSRLVTFPGCGHCPQEEVPVRFNDVVDRFLRGDG